MNKFKTHIFSILTIATVILLFWGCDNYSDDQKEYIAKLDNFRAEKNIEFRDSSYSPFNRKSKVEFHPLNYFNANFDFIFTGKLIENNIKDTVKVYGTKGEERKSVRYGLLKLENKRHNLDVNIYETLARDGVTKYYSIWFTDKTTNNESYGVGRYVDFELNTHVLFQQKKIT